MKTSVVVLLAALVLTLLAATSAPTAQADQDPSRVSGKDPVETALAYSGLVEDGEGTRVLVTTSATFADSLASGLLQGHWNAPLLLTPGDSLDERVVAELQRLGAERVTILGGADAVTLKVESQLAGVVSEVDRISGDTRIATALAVADAVYDEIGTDSVILARAFGTEDGDESRAFVDAIAAGSAAAARAYPVILTPTDSLDPEVAEWMVERGTRRVIIAGGTAAISQEVEDQLSEIGIERIARAGGLSRVGTAVRLNGYTAASGPIVVVQSEGELAWASGFAAALHSPGGVMLATGEVVPADTLSAVLGRGGDPGVRCGVALGDQQCRLVSTAANVQIYDDPYEALVDGDQMVPPVQTDESATTGIWLSGDDAICVGLTRYQTPTGAINADVYRGEFGETGERVIKLHISPQEALPGSYFGCTVDIGEQLMEAFIGAPGEFYVRVDTDAHPEGELRGQTFLPPDQPYLRIASHPELVIPGPGEPDARAFTLVIPTGVEDELCVYTDIEVLADPPTEIHIHEGGPKATGDVVFTLDPGPASGRSVHCNRGVNSDRLADMFANPTSYYMDIHTASYPDGALRGNAIIDHATDEH